MKNRFRKNIAENFWMEKMGVWKGESPRQKETAKTIAFTALPGEKQGAHSRAPSESLSVITERTRTRRFYKKSGEGRRTRALVDF